ncbi:MAG: hypothetical protein AB1430_19865 [Pseudomonadota bacterium]
MLARVFAFALLSALCISSRGQPLPEPAEGFLCCTMRTDGDWISDANYADERPTLVPAGTPIKATGYGRYRVHVLIAGAKQAIGNDYSRKLDMASFARRYIVAEDPQVQQAAYPAEVREAIRKGRLTLGMTREQAIMALGYPVMDLNPSLDAQRWRYEVTGGRPFVVVFSEDGRVSEVEGDARARGFVLGEGEWATVTEWSEEQEPETPEKACAINVYRVSTRNFMVDPERPFVYLNGNRIGSLPAGESYCLDAPPGKHVVSLREAAFPGIPGFSEREVEVVVDGAPVFVRYRKAFTGSTAIGTSIVKHSRIDVDRTSEAQWREERAAER